MKNRFTLFSGILVLLISFQSCTAESEEATPNASELEEELALENKGVLKVEAITYIFKETGETSKFNDEHRNFNFKFIDELPYSTSTTSKHAIEGLTITNPNTGEYMIFSNFEALKNGFDQFDIELSTGQVLTSVLFKPGKANNSSNKWHDGWPIVEEPSPVIGAMIELSQQVSLSECGSTDACAEEGNNSTISLTNGDSWFGGIEDCSVECAE
ncbi:hypothetical protein GUB10_08775 [Salegentibacter sp. BLCTC]|uniref:hypothetical protein n=1 Tax=Salegentibacter sp. BLCTC TaxID=2697368 RepID=UPI00187B432D|nr:hypothetical protein [Salegentibacter sp. BLCTC]MBE7640424.1 hypothetical protein [Salegentibacter sp. BLCTC]